MLVHYVRVTASLHPNGSNGNNSGSGDIWEWGGGTGSTPLLRLLAEQSGRQLITVEDSPEFLRWLHRFYPPAPHHRYIPVGGGGGAEAKKEEAKEEEAEEEGEGRGAGGGGKAAGLLAEEKKLNEWLAVLSELDQSLPTNYLASVVFVDQWPEAARWHSLQFFAHRARFIVVHDAPLDGVGIPLPLPMLLPAMTTTASFTAEDSDSSEEAVGQTTPAPPRTRERRRTDLSLFRRGAIHESEHCWPGPATMVVTMQPDCEVSPAADIFGLDPGQRAPLVSRRQAEIIGM